MSVAGTDDVVIDQAATFRARIEWADDAGNPIAPTAPAVMELRDAKGVLAIRLTDGAGLTLDPDGWIDVVITDEQTETITPGKYDYDVFAHKPDGDRDRLVFGKATVRKAVSRRVPA